MTKEDKTEFIHIFIGNDTMPSLKRHLWCEIISDKNASIDSTDIYEV